MINNDRVAEGSCRVMLAEAEAEAAGVCASASSLMLHIHPTCGGIEGA
jgi:hypothetical protein